LSIDEAVVHSIGRPHLEYGNVVWHPQLRKDIDMIESVQHRATKMIPGLANISYEDRLKSLNLPSLEYRRLRGDAIKAFKYIKRIYSDYDPEFLPLHKTVGMITRGHQFKLKKRECHGKQRANFFSLRIVNVWNSLPEEVVNSKSVNEFKGRFDRCYKELQFSKFTDLEENFAFLQRC
jgi:ribonuclease P/MRP protein subunit RPP40